MTIHHDVDACAILASGGTLDDVLAAYGTTATAFFFVGDDRLPDAGELLAVAPAATLPEIAVWSDGLGGTLLAYEVAISRESYGHPWVTANGLALTGGWGVAYEDGSPAPYSVIGTTTRGLTGTATIGSRNGARCL